MGLYGDADLVVTKDVSYTRTVKYAINSVFINWNLYNVKAEARDRWNSLVFDLSPFFSVSGGDNTVLVFSIAADFTYALPQEARWDILATLKTDAAQGFRTPQPSGRVLLLRGITSRV